MVVNKRLLALDVGEKRIGVAISDENWFIATPYEVIDVIDFKNAIKKIIEITNIEYIGCIIVGLPISLKGEIGFQAQKVLEFCKMLETETDLPIRTWDERFSSAEADHRLREAGLSKSKFRRQINASAAAVILQAYMDVSKSVI